ncbi:MAG: ABC transporter ATP-binding protein [Acidobacteria bacterium]|nr:ABC transporter ATP-binding protein [Acidobacteriota bacterium]
MSDAPAGNLPWPLEVTGVSRRIGERQVLDDVSLTVGRGRMCALVGPNGAGKTSLLRVISGRLRTDRGQVQLLGQSIGEARQHGVLGLVPQDLAVYPSLTIRENLEVLGTLAGVARRALSDRIRESLQWAGLADRAEHRLSSLSGGMKRRVNLIAGLLHQPSLLLLDEPTVGVDAASEGRLYVLLSSLRASGMGIVLATHHLDDAAACCDDVVVMHEGRVVASGAVSEVVARAFPEGREVVVLLADVPGDRSVSVMQRDAFRQIGARTWARAWSASLADVDRLEADWLAAGVVVAETRVRQPSLRGAVAVLTGHAAGGES